MTLNGFPYVGFGRAVVKTDVYLPDWSDPARLAYTLAQVRGSHGRLPTDPADGPVLICSDASAARDRYEVTEVKSLLLRLAGAVSDS